MTLFSIDLLKLDGIRWCKMVEKHKHTYGDTHTHTHACMQQYRCTNTHSDNMTFFLKSQQKRSCVFRLFPSNLSEHMNLNKHGSFKVNFLNKIQANCNSFEKNVHLTIYKIYLWKKAAFKQKITIFKLIKLFANWPEK